MEEISELDFISFDMKMAGISIWQNHGKQPLVFLYDNSRFDMCGGLKCISSSCWSTWAFEQLQEVRFPVLILSQAKPVSQGLHNTVSLATGFVHYCDIPKVYPVHTKGYSGREFYHHKEKDYLTNVQQRP